MENVTKEKLIAMGFEPVEVDDKHEGAEYYKKGLLVIHIDNDNKMSIQTKITITEGIKSIEDLKWIINREDRLTKTMPREFRLVHVLKIN